MSISISRRIRALRSQQGQTAVEFALIAPLLIVLLLGVVQFGIAFNNYLTITDAARAGARNAIVLRFSGGSVDDVKAAVRAAAPGLDPLKLKIDVVAAPGWTSGSDVTVTVKYPYSISLLDWVVAGGDVTSTMKERIE
jgi:Flp pilus assembly protein TadG